MSATTSRPEAADERGSSLQLVGTMCLTALTLATVISLCRVFPDWEYLTSMVAVVVGVHAIAALLRYAGAGVLLAAPLLALAIAELIAIVYYRDTLYGPLPSGRTLELFRIDIRLVVEQFPTAVAPVPSIGSYAVAAAVALAFAAALSDTFAFRALGRMEAVVPTGVIFVFTSALGTDRHRVAVAALWVGTALLTVAVLRVRHTSEEASWMGARRWGLAAAFPAILVTFGLTAVVAAAVAPRLPGAGEVALVDTRNRQGSVTEVLSPLVDIGAQLRNRGNLELFTVESSDGPHYLRAFASPKFTGDQWEPVEEDLQPMGNRSGDVLLDGPVTNQIIRILGLGGNTVPAAYRPVSVSPSEVLWTESTHMLVLPQPSVLQRGDEIAITSIVPRPSAELLRSATVANAPAGSTDLPDGVPQVARDQAISATSGATAPYEAAIALQNWFRSNFRYDVTVQYGGSYDAIEAFLRDRAGFCQQFAGTFAVMARSLGLPTRIAVGYTPGDLQADGRYHVYGRHAHTWPEVWFDGIGWVPFEPTPGRGSPDSVDYTGVTPEQAVGGDGGDTGNAPQTTAAPVPNPNDPGVSTTLPAGGQPGGGAAPTTLAGGAGGSGGDNGTPMVLWVLAGLLLAVLAWMLVAPRVVRALGHRHAHTPREHVISIWQRTLGTLSMAGAPAVGSSTPIEYAALAERTTGVDYRSVRELAMYVTDAVYSTRELDDRVVTRCQLLFSQIDTTCQLRVPTAVRLQALVDPRLMRRRLAG